jgi:hypothetical protein
MFPKTNIHTFTSIPRKRQSEESRIMIYFVAAMRGEIRKADKSREKKRKRNSSSDNRKTGESDEQQLKHRRQPLPLLKRKHNDRR